VSIFFTTGTIKRSFYGGFVDLAFAIGTNWGVATPSPSLTMTDLSWGPMLVNFVDTLTPGAEDNPNPPEALAPVDTYPYRVYIPVTTKP
jgi:hypothetical protein